MDIRIDGTINNYSFSEYPDVTGGVNLFNGNFPQVDHTGETEIDFDDLPEAVQLAVIKHLVVKRYDKIEPTITHA